MDFTSCGVGIGVAVGVAAGIDTVGLAPMGLFVGDGVGPD
jgi:hypothetical protein